MTTLRALSVRQPWAWAIALGGKHVENRHWSTRHRGLLAIHASCRRGWDQDSGALDSRIIRAVHDSARTPDGRLDPPIACHLNQQRTRITELSADDQRWAFGAIVGVARLVDIHAASECPGQCAPWGSPGGHHWVLSDARALAEPVPCKGRLGLWQLPPEVEAAVRGQLAEVSHG